MSSSADTEMPSPSSRWFTVVFYDPKPEEGEALCYTHERLILTLEQWCKKHAPLKKAFVAGDKGRVIGLFQFETAKTVSNLNRLLQGALTDFSGRIDSMTPYESQEEFDTRVQTDMIAVIKHQPGVPKFYYARDGAAATTVETLLAAPVAEPAPTAALAARYRGTYDDIIEKSRKSVPQVKHDGVVVETRSHTVMTHPTEVVTCVLPGLGDLNVLHRAFTNLRLTCETGAISCHAKLLIGDQSIEERRAFIISAEPTTSPLFNLEGDACVPVRAFMEIKLQLRFFTDKEVPVKVSYDVVTEQIEATAEALEAAASEQESSVLAGDIPLLECVDREQIFEQRQYIMPKCQRDGSTPFYTLPLIFNNPVTRIELYLPSCVEAAWLLLDFENHGLHLKKGESDRWSIAFDTPINFSNIESAKLVFRVNRSAESLNDMPVNVFAYSLNILRVFHGMASVAFAISIGRAKAG
jgi:hypothetical protein